MKTPVKTMTTTLSASAIAALLAVGITVPAGAQQDRSQDRQMQSQQDRQSRTDTRSQASKGQEQRATPMEYRQIQGTIRDARRVKVRGTDEMATLVLLETADGNRAVVDLGTERIGIRLREGQELAVRGRPVKLGDQRIVLQAQAIRYGDRTFDVNRPARNMGAMRSAMERSAERGDD